MPRSAEGVGKGPGMAEVRARKARVGPTGASRDPLLGRLRDGVMTSARGKNLASGAAVVFEHRVEQYLGPCRTFLEGRRFLFVMGKSAEAGHENHGGGRGARDIGGIVAGT